MMVVKGGKLPTPMFVLYVGLATLYGISERHHTVGSSHPLSGSYWWHIPIL